MIYLLSIFGLLYLYFGYRLGFWLYTKNVLIGIDQMANVVLLGGHPDETLSSRAYRLYRDNEYWYSKYPMIIIDLILFFDTDMHEGYKIGHCRKSYISEQNRKGIKI